MGYFRIMGDFWIIGDFWFMGDSWIMCDSWIFGYSWIMGDFWIIGYSWTMGDFSIMGEGDRDTNRQTKRHINAMTRPGLRDGPSESGLKCVIFRDFFYILPILYVNSDWVGKVRNWQTPPPPPHF